MKEKKIDAEILLSRSLSLFLDEIQKGKKDNEFRIGAAAILSIEGKKEEALSWMQKAVNINWVDYSVVEFCPWFDNIKETPQFKQIINTVKKRVDEMRAEAEKL